METDWNEFRETEPCERAKISEKIRSFITNLTQRWLRDLRAILKK